MPVLKTFDSAPIEIKRRERTAEGFLDVWGVAAKVGTMEYPEHGFNAYVPAETLRDAAPWLVGQPITVEHPEDGVTPDNARLVVVGSVLESSFDEPSGEQRVHLRLYDAEAIALVEGQEKAELSPGYDVSYADATDEQRAAHGAEKIQMGRIYNHLALVEAGRGGPTVRLNLDSIRGGSVPTKKKTTDAEPENIPAPGAPQDADPEQMSDADMRKMYDMLKAKFEPKDADPAPEPEKPKDADPEAEKPGAPSMDSLLARHLKAMDAARAMGLDPAAHGSNTLAIEREVAEMLVGEKAKTADASALSLVMDAAIASAGRPTHITDLKGRSGKDKANDANPDAEFGLSPEQKFLRNRFQPNPKSGK